MTEEKKTFVKEIVTLVVSVAFALGVIIPSLNAGADFAEGMAKSDHTAIHHLISQIKHL